MEADNIANENLKVAPEVIKYISDENGFSLLRMYWKFYFEVNRWKPAGCLVEVRGTIVNYSM